MPYQKKLVLLNHNVIGIVFYWEVKKNHNMNRLGAGNVSFVTRTLGFNSGANMIVLLKGEPPSKHDVTTERKINTF